MADDLNTPLGQNRKRTQSQLPGLVPMVVAGMLGLWTVAFLLWAMVGSDPFGGESRQTSLNRFHAKVVQTAVLVIEPCPNLP